MRIVIANVSTPMRRRLLAALSLTRCDAHPLLQCMPSNRPKQAQPTLRCFSAAHSGTIL
ncbi:hypothetical protein [Xanthomonas cassavae]|uniref:hypothetical protein n=1 Tax=Xanthomonas cassavae TaxID=56450 RepID=UPI00041B1A94|nr:hypothetical protein [Xanthomonas cassavae]